MATTNSRLANQGLWIGSGFTGDLGTSLFIPGQLGMVVISPGGLARQLVQFKSTSTTIAAGTPVGWTDQDDFVVSAKQTDLNRNLPAGFALGTVAAGSYGWIQVAGPYATVIVDGASYAAGDSLILGSSTDGQAIKVAAGTASTYLTLGIVTATISALAGTGAAYISCPHNGW